MTHIQDHQTEPVIPTGTRRAGRGRAPGQPAAALSAEDREAHVCCLKPQLCRDEHFHERDVAAIRDRAVANALAEVAAAIGSTPAEAWGVPLYGGVTSEEQACSFRAANAAIDFAARIVRARIPGGAS